MKDYLGTMLQGFGLMVAAVSVGAIYAPAGGIVAAIGFVLFGIAVEKD